jgi:hypothetical protein
MGKGEKIDYLGSRVWGLEKVNPFLYIPNTKP